MEHYGKSSHADDLLEGFPRARVAPRHRVGVHVTPAPRHTVSACHTRAPWEGRQATRISPGARSCSTSHATSLTRFLICQDLEIELVYHFGSPVELGRALCESSLQSPQLKGISSLSQRKSSQNFKSGRELSDYFSLSGFLNLESLQVHR